MTPKQYELVEMIFAEACELPPDRRGALLDERSGGDPIVRREVEVMLVADGASDDEFTNPGWSCGITQTDDGAHAFRAQAIPDRIGRYRVIRECGHGGMGVVYEAEQSSPKRRVALKVIRTGVVSRQVLRRFHNETEVLGRLQHPGIAQIFEADSFDIGEGVQPFFVMEYIEGRSLLEYATAHDLDVKGRLALFVRVCDAVHYAHQMGVIHRDLKPDNVLVDSLGQPKVLDFGVARMTDADVQMTTIRTDMGQLVGTIQYMSPEQTAGDSGELDPRSDIYALGVMLFELLGDRLPYDLRNRSLPESLLVIRQDDPKRLSSVSPTFRGDIDTIVGKCLEKEPERRYEWAADLAEDIRRYLRDEPISAEPPSAWYQLRKFTRRNRTLVGGTIATILTLAAGVIVATVLLIRAESNAEAARWASYRASITAASALILDDPVTANEYLQDIPAERRGWEWDHLHSRLEGHTLSYVGPTLIGDHFSITGDGAHLVATLVDDHVAVWDARSADLIRTLPFEGTITSMALPARGPSRLAVVLDGARLVMCDLDGGGRVEVPVGSSDPDVDERAAHVVWDQQGTRLAVVTRQRVLIWEGGRRLRELIVESQLNEQVVCDEAAVFSPDGALLAGLTVRDPRAAGINYLVVYDVVSGQQLVKREFQDTGIALAYAGGDGSRLYVGTHQRTIAEVDTKAFEVSRWLTGHRKEVAYIACSSSGEFMASSSEDGTIRLWRSGSNVGVFRIGAASPIAFSENGASLVYRADGELRRWDLSAEIATVLDEPTTYVYQVGYALDGSLLASKTYDGRICVWDPIGGRLLNGLASKDLLWADGDPPLWNSRGRASLGFTDDGRLATGGVYLEPLTGVVLDRFDDEMISKGRLGELPPPWSRMSPSYVWNEDRTLLAANDSRLALHVFDTAGACQLRLPAYVTVGAAFGPGTTLLATASSLGQVDIWDVATSELIAELHGHDGEVFCVDFHPDGTRLASGGSDGTIRLWDTETWETVHVLRGHTNYVKTLVFSPDGSQLASGSGDSTVRIWDTVSRAERARQATAARATTDQP